ARRARISDLHRDEHRCRLQLLLPTEHHTRRYPIATRHLGKSRARLPRLLDDAALVRLAEAPPMAIACRRHDQRRLRRAVSENRSRSAGAKTSVRTMDAYLARLNFLVIPKKFPVMAAKIPCSVA